MTTERALLARYVEAKDFTRPALMAAIYRQDAVLTYSIATDAISFPARTEGVDAITRVLVVEFGARYRDCRTYYLEDCRREQPDEWRIPWLVVMREPQAQALRIGRGFYRWCFDRTPATLRVAAMHIHIERMDAIADPQAQSMRAIQAALPYPWLTSATLRSALGELQARDARFAFLDDFLVPMALP